MLIAKICPECGTKYTGHHARKYCSNVCLFWSCFDKSAGPDGCWPWLGHANKTSGYGSVNAETAGRRTYAHQHAYRLTHGATGGLHVLHHCDNRLCGNPAHLFLGTPYTNWLDSVTKGRQTTTIPKLTEAEVRAIRRSSDAVRDLAAQHRVAAQTIRAVLAGRTWRHLIAAE